MINIRSEDVNYILAGVTAQISRNSGYMARAEIERILANLADEPRRLEHYGFKVYSQNDEDGIIEEIFKRLNISKGIFCEIGVENGLECNSLYLLHKGWRGFWIEGNIKQQTFIETKFESVIKNKKLVLCIGYAHPDNINNLVAKKLSPRLAVKCEDIDFMSIDIDGMDIYIFETLDFNPKVICIEYNAKFPANVSKQLVYNKAHTWSGGDYMGSSLLAIKRVADTKGYTLVATNITGANAFFVRNDLIKDNFKSYDIGEIYNPPRYYLYYDHFKSIGHKADFNLYADMINDRDQADIFSDIYKNNMWGKSTSPDQKFYSGTGTHTESIVNTYINAVTEFLTSLDGKPDVVDLGCGDFYIGKKLRYLCSNYVACDVVESLIEAHKIMFKELDVDFIRLNLSTDKIPVCDVIFIRQVLQHLSNDHIFPIISQLHENVKYLVLTEHIPLSDNFSPNLDVTTGKGIRLSSNSGVVLTSAPFNLMVEDSRVLCECIENSGRIQTILYTLK